MRMKIKAVKKENGKYIMIAEVLHGRGARELPQEGREHDSKKTVYADAYQMYAGHAWQYNPVSHIIKC